tara:strand:- start:663 stop:1076 length:414 start_codon:yes stop_codon:yes gene_type:complete
MSEVLDLLTSISGQLDELIEALPSQETVLESRDVERITRLVEERSRVIESMVDVSERVPALLGSSKDDPAVSDLVRTLDGKLQAVLEADRKAEALMSELTRDLGGQLRQANTTLVARDAYKPATNSQPSARFSDREG